MIIMEKILEKIDKMLKKVRQEEVECQTRVGFLYEVIKRTKGKQITLRTKNPQGKKEELMVSERGVYLLDKDTYRYNQMIDLTSGNKEEVLKIFSNSPGRIKNILQKALKGEVEIEIT